MRELPFLLDRDVGRIRKIFDRFTERIAVCHSHELNSIASFAASEAVPETFREVHMQGWLLICMKRALAHQIGTRLPESDAFGFKNALDVCVGANSFNKLVRIHLYCSRY